MKEPTHSGQYLVTKLLEATNDFGITTSVGFVTWDNITANDLMVKHFESGARKLAKGNGSDPQWAFTVEEDYVWCMAHIINLPV